MNKTDSVKKGYEHMRAYLNKFGKRVHEIAESPLSTNDKRTAVGKEFGYLAKMGIRDFLVPTKYEDDFRDGMLNAWKEFCKSSHNKEEL